MVSAPSTIISSLYSKFFSNTAFAFINALVIALIYDFDVSFRLSSTSVVSIVYFTLNKSNMSFLLGEDEAKISFIFSPCR